MNDYRWSIGTVIGLPLLALLVVVLLAGGAWLLWIRPTLDKYDRGPGLVLAILLLFCAVLAVGGTAWGMWPYKAEYHQWQNISGTVEAIDSRLVGANKSTTERFVVTFDDGRQRSCDDTRCAQVEEGDELVLACKRAYQWSGTHGYDCNYVSHRPVR